MKAIEVQLSVHRAPETSRMQQEQLQRPLIDQAQLAGQATAEIERSRHRSAPTTEAADAKIRKDAEGNNQHDSHGEGEHVEPEAEMRTVAAPHPFKGKHLDLSL